MSDLKTAALEYHANPRPGKLSVELTKATATARDLSLAYSPGVAEPVREIARDPELAYKYTGKGNLVAVISDGTAILGLATTAHWPPSRRSEAHTSELQSIMRISCAVICLKYKQKKETNNSNNSDS